MMGVVMSSYVVVAINSPGVCGDLAIKCGTGLVPFTLAVMCVPVFDTLRVMVMRILRRTSPFHPDKTHLHHLFIELGFSHVGTTFSVLALNFVVVLAWYFTFLSGASIDIQFYVVVGCGFGVTAVFYKFMRIQIVRQTAIARVVRKLGGKTHVAEKRGWQMLQRLADHK